MKLWREHSSQKQRRAQRYRAAGAAKRRLPAKHRLALWERARIFRPFFDYAGIPSLDMGFGGDYGVYHSLYDDFYWMKHFGDPTFVYHATLARILGTVALRLDEADVLPFDYSAYASGNQHG